MESGTAETVPAGGNMGMENTLWGHTSKQGCGSRNTETATLGSMTALKVSGDHPGGHTVLTVSLGL